jgi:hypothetical protein
VESSDRSGFRCSATAPSRHGSRITTRWRPSIGRSRADGQSANGCSTPTCQRRWTPGHTASFLIVLPGTVLAGAAGVGAPKGQGSFPERS